MVVNETQESNAKTARLVRRATTPDGALTQVFVRHRDQRLTDHGLGKVGSSSRNDKELLESELVAGMFTTVNDIEARNGERVGNRVAGDFGIVLPERHALGSGTSLTSSEGD